VILEQSTNSLKTTTDEHTAPPNAEMLALMYSSASHWSLKPKFPEILGSSQARKPKAERR
jgi:hypothetical protein